MVLSLLPPIYGESETLWGTEPKMKFVIAICHVEVQL